MTNVLLIEQEYISQKAFSKMFDSIPNCELVGIAESGSEAMTLLNRHHPQVIFADAVMGDESGIDICKKVKKYFPKVVVYILSNFYNLKLLEESMLSGVEEYILKPLSRTKLSSLMEKNYSENVMEEDCSHRLYEVIEKKDYREASNVAFEVVKQYFEESSRSLRLERFRQLGANLFYMVPGMDNTQKDYYLQKFQLDIRTASDPVYSSCWLMEIITEIFRQLCVMKYAHMGKVFQYIEKNKNNDIMLSDLSEQAGISSGYLSRIFKKYYHISVVDYIHLRKLQQAKYYMVSSEMNISDISFLLGYSEAGYFCKIFKKYEKMTPTAFHNNYLKMKKQVVC